MEQTLGSSRKRTMWLVQRQIWRQLADRARQHGRTDAAARSFRDADATEKDRDRRVLSEI